MTKMNTSDFLDKIWLKGGATGRINLINRIKVVFPGVRRLGELVTVDAGNVNKSHIRDTMKLNSYYLGVQGN